MTERPILFSGAMARAILAGRKTQTRRVMALPEVMPPVVAWAPNGSGWKGVGRNPAVEQQFITTWPMHLRCPYGVPGDRLWVREEHYRFGHWEEVPGVRTKGGRQKWKFVADTPEVLFDAPAEFRKGRHHKDPATPAWHKRLARFMPRWASRITLEVTEVRVERLQGISEADAWAEGIPDDGSLVATEAQLCARAKEMDLPATEGRVSYAELWDSINGKRAPWASNPWVWVVGFRRVVGTGV